MYLGNANTSTTCHSDMEDDGADGIVLAFKSLSANNTGTSGGMLGFGGITPSVGIEFDTYPNGVSRGDSISQDHTALVINGSVIGPLKGPVPLMPGGANVEDGNFHLARLIWDPSTFTLSLYFDGVLKFTHTQDFVTTVFGNNPFVQFGAVSSTGSCYNTQTICFPVLQIDLDDVYFCEGDSTRVVFSYPNPDSYLWLDSKGDTIVYWDTTFSVPFSDSSFFVKDTGKYILQITSGAVHLIDTLEAFQNTLPVFTLGNDTLICKDSSVVFDPGNWESYLWSNSSTTQIITAFNSGEYWVEIEDTNGCRNRDTVLLRKQITTVNFNGDKLFGCEPLAVNFYDLSTINTGANIGYEWDFGDGNTSVIQNPSTVYSTKGDYSVNLKVITDIGCEFDTTKTNYVEVFPFAIADFNTFPVVGKESNPVSFNNTSANSTIWYWDFGDATSSTNENPIKTYSASGRYTVTLIASNGGGCSDTTDKLFDVIKSQVYFAPNSFTPDDNGINENWHIYGIEYAIKLIPVQKSVSEY